MSTENNDPSEEEIDRARRLFLKGMAAVGFAVPAATLILTARPDLGLITPVPTTSIPPIRWEPITPVPTTTIPPLPAETSATTTTPPS